MKLWSGRFNKDTDSLMDDFHSSISFDYKLYKEDIQGSIAHATMLGKQGIIDMPSSQLIVKTLKEIMHDIEQGHVEFSVSAEDIHMNVESILIDRIGDTGKKLHTGRSRNDQVALDMRMHTKEQIIEISSSLSTLIDVLIKKAEVNTDTIMPGFTHLQKAQPITLAHHIMAYVYMFLRDMDRLKDCYKRTDVMPLGSGALAGITYDLDREFVKEQLGFAEISYNSLDAVCDRDFCIELADALSIIMMHLSRFCEEIVIWNNDEFGYVEIDDGFATGSSIMPQKKNPDAAELIRGKTGRVYGDLMGLLTMMKSLPLSYDKDLQEDKEAMFDAEDTVKSCLAVFTKMFDTLTFKNEKLYVSAQKGYTNATDVADYLVRKGIPFRDAHEIVGKLVYYCIGKGIALLDLSLDEFKEFSPKIENDIYEDISLEYCVGIRKLPGGPAKTAVIQSIEIAKQKKAQYTI